MTNQEYNLTIMDIVWEDGNLYETNKCKTFVVKHGELYFNFADVPITRDYPLNIILGMRFKKIIDWSKVPVDTKLLVRDSEDDAWERRYFAEYADGEIYAWHDGKTSWSAKYPYNMCSWNYAKLATEGE